MRALLATALLLAGLLAACAPREGGPAPAAPAARAPGEAARPHPNPLPGGEGAGAAAPAPTSAALPDKVRALYSSRNVDSLVFYVADKYGYWSQEGLNVELGYAATGAATAAQLAGEAQVLAGGGPPSIAAAAQGADVRLIAGIFNSTPFRLMAEPAIRTAADLKGKRIGITRFGSVTDMTARLAVERIGLNPDSDVEYVTMNDIRVMLAGLSSGVIQAGMAYPPDTAPLEDAGYNTLYDPAKEGFPFQHKAVEITARWAEQYPAAVDRVVRGVVRAIHFMRTNRAETIAALSEFIDVTDRRGLEQAYDEIILRLIPAEPFASVEGTRWILEFMARRDPHVRDVDPARLIDNRWVQQLVDSGFIAQLYGR